MKRNRKILLVFVLVITLAILQFTAVNEVLYTKHAHYKFDQSTGNGFSPQRDSMENVLWEEMPKEDGYFPVDGRSVCPYLGIRKVPYIKTNHVMTNNRCSKRVPARQECQKAYDSYRIGDEPLSCHDKHFKPAELCTITHEQTLDRRTTMIGVKCDISSCGKNPVFVASLDPANGEIEKIKKWKKFSSVKELEGSLPTIIAKNTQDKLHFCFLQCLSYLGNTTLKTILTFPPKPQLSEKLTTMNNNLFNINVLVLDSVSRPHFYRTLPKTVATLRDISYNNTLNSTVVDFELFQSLGPFTYINLKAFFTGNTLYHAEGSQQKHKDYQYYYGFDKLYKKIKEKGFHTMFQEDLCWHDVWGTILANTRKNLVRDNGAERRKQSWQRLLREVEESKIDDTGVTMATCRVLQQYNLTNHFNKPDKVCYGSKIFTQYFLEYLEKSFSRLDEQGVRRQPIFAYTHLSIAHEGTGTRLKQADRGLSNYLKKLAEDQNTLTILFSDHGPKTTKYSIQSREGAYELYTPFLFLIIPEKIARIVGKERMKNIITNQKRLVTLKDVNAALTSILENMDFKDEPAVSKSEGFFSEIPENRTCDQIRNVDVLCVCSEFDSWVPDNHVNFTWIAEFAIGALNNKIQRLYAQSMRGKYDLGGFGKCQRLVGKRFQKIHLRKNPKNFYVTMDITTRLLRQSFQVIVKFPSQPASLKHRFKRKKSFGKLLSYRRLSAYQSFLECKDANVEIQLCVCRRKNSNDFKAKPSRYIVMNSTQAVHEVIRRGRANFGGSQDVQRLDEKCLYLITRSHEHRETLVYEIANACSHRSYEVQVRGESVSKIQTSSSLPQKVVAEPLTVRFVLTVYHIRKPLDFTLFVTFRILPN